jgi:hypothetical protein
MKVTKQQKVLGAVMLVGLLLVGADQLGALPGSSAGKTDDSSGYAAAEFKVVATPAATPTPVPLPTTATRSSVAQRLRHTQRFATDNTLRDVFAVGPAWLAQAEQGAKVDPLAASIEKFRQSHRLTGVLSSSGREHAMVDNQIVAVGQSVDGFKLVSVSHRSATFESGEARVVLNMTAGAVAGAQ